MKVKLPDTINDYEVKVFQNMTGAQIGFIFLAVMVFLIPTVLALFFIPLMVVKVIIMTLSALLAGVVVYITNIQKDKLSTTEYLRLVFSLRLFGAGNRPTNKTGTDHPPEPEFKPEPPKKFQFRFPFGKKDTGPKPLRYIPNTAQNTLPFQQIYENGLVLLYPRTTDAEKRFSLIFQFENCDYLLQREEDKEEKARQYADILATLPEFIHLQEVYMTAQVDVDGLRQAIIPKQTDPAIPDSIVQEYKEIQNGYITEVASHISDCQLYGILSYQSDNDLENVYRILLESYERIHNGLLSLGSASQLLTPEQELALLHQTLYPYEPPEQFVLPEALYVKGLTVKDVILTDDIHISEYGVRVGRDTRMQIYYARSYSTVLEDTFISDLLATKEHILVTKHIDRIPPDDARNKISQRFNELQAEAQDRKKDNKMSGTDYIPYNLEREITACKKMLDELGESQQVFRLGVYILAYSDTDAKRKQMDTFVKTTCSRNHVVVSTVGIRQEAAFSTVLPLGMDRLCFTTNHISRALSVTHPFTYRRMLEQGGYFYGINSISHTSIIHNRKEDVNGHAFVTGMTGTGKSMFSKMEIIDTRMLCPNDQIFYIDPHNDLAKLTPLVGGQVVRIAPGSETAINPFDIYSATGNDLEDAVRGKTALLFGLTEVWKGEPLTAKERSILDRCIMQVYQPYLKDPKHSPERIPTMPDFAEVLKRQPEPEAQDLFLYLEMYVLGSVDCFAKRTNISTDNPCIDFQLGGLGSHLQISGMMFLLDFIQQRTRLNHEHGRWSWLYADEFQEYYRSSSAGAFFESVFAGYRKLGGLATGITQNITDLNNYPNGKAMLANANMVVLLANAKQNIELAQELYNLSDDQCNKLKERRTGSGLLITGTQITPFTHAYKTDSKIYKSITTRFQDEIAEMAQS